MVTGGIHGNNNPPISPRDDSPPPELLSRLVEAEKMTNEARGVPPSTAPDPITLFEVKEALQVGVVGGWPCAVYMVVHKYGSTPPCCVQHNRHVIPSHSVYTLTMEHILASLWHPSQQESLAKESTTHWRTHLAAHN